MDILDRNRADQTDRLRGMLVTKRLRIDPQDFASLWHDTVLVFHVAKPKFYESGLWQVRNFRGAFLDALYASSGEAGRGAARGVRPFDFFRDPKISIRGKNICPPFVVTIEDQGKTLIIRVVLFGYAGLWRDDILTHIYMAFQNGIRMGEVTAVKARLELVDYYFYQNTSLACPSPRGESHLQMRTPLQLSTDKLGQPRTLSGAAFAGLVDRLNAVALWMGYDLWVEDGSAFFNPIRNMIVKPVSVEQVHSYDRKRRQGRIVPDSQQGVMGTFKLGAIPSHFWPLLWIGQHSHMGQNAVKGFGRYKLILS